MKYSIKAMISCTALAFALVSITGCQTQRHRVVTQQNLVTGLEEMGVNPVLPPTEDVQVGDIHVASGSGSPATHWGTLRLMNEVRSEYEYRPSLPLTPLLGEEDGRGGSDGWSQATRDGGIYVEQESQAEGEYSRFNRLRLVAMPELVINSLEDVNVTTFVPAEALSIGMAMGEGFQSLSLKWVSAEGYGIPAHIVIDKLLKRHDDQFYLPAEGMFKDLPVHDRDQSGAVEFTVITHVIYGRVLDVGMTFSRDIIEDDVVSLSLDADGADENSVDGTRSLDDRIREFIDQDVPGGKLRHLGSSKRSISVRRIYERPVAIATRGLRLRVDTSTIEAGRGYQVLGTSFEVTSNQAAEE